MKTKDRPKKSLQPLTEAVAASRTDNWQNLSTGFGTTRDKLTYGYYVADIRITDFELSSLYHGSALASRIVDFKPREMFRRGYELGFTEDDETEIDESAAAAIAEELRKRGADLSLDEMTREAMIWGRLYGGALLILGADDGQDPVMPLNEKRIRAFRFLNVIDRRFVQIARYYTDPLLPKYGKPEVYQIINSLGGNVSLIHETRVIRFDGDPTDALRRRELAGWTYSVLQKLYETIRDFSQAFQAAGNLLSDASQAVFKLQGLIEQIAGGNVADLQTRMQLVDMSRSAARAVLIDAENEDFNRIPTAFSGIPEILDRFMQKLAGDTGIPVAILMGRSVAGLNATGESDFRMFYDNIVCDQEAILKPILIRLYSLIALASDGPKGASGREIEVKFRPLWQPTDSEQADLELKVAQKDVAYITAGVLLPEEVAISRFSGGQFRLTTDIDTEAREKALEQEVTFDPNAPAPGEVAGKQITGAKSKVSPAGPQDPVQRSAEPDEAAGDDSFALYGQG